MKKLTQKYTKIFVILYKYVYKKILVLLKGNIKIFFLLKDGSQK